MSLITKMIAKADKCERLTAEEELKKLKEYRAGRIDSAEEILMPNLRGIMKIAYAHKGMGVSMEDLFSIGCQTFIANLDKFDIERSDNECRVFSVIRNYLSNAMKDAVSKQGGAVSTSRKIRKKTHISLNEKINGDDGEGSERQDLLADDKDSFTAAENAELADYAISLMEKVLDERERYIVTQCVMHHVLQKDVAMELGYTPTRVGQLQKTAICKLREAMAREC